MQKREKIVRKREKCVRERGRSFIGRVRTVCRGGKSLIERDVRKFYGWIQNDQ